MEIQKTFYLVTLMSLLCSPAFGAEAAKAPSAGEAGKAAKLLFYATFDGSAKADKAGGDAMPSITNGLDFVLGHRGKALYLPRSGTHALAYPAKGNLIAERGTLFCWMRANWADRPHEEWRHLAVAWDETGPKVYFDGLPCPEIQNAAGRDFALTDVLAFPNAPEFFYIGGANGKRSSDIWLDDFRIYSEPLSAAQIREFARGETVAEITLKQSAIFADHKTMLEVKCASPVGIDLSELKYCIHTKDGKPVVVFRDTVKAGPVKLPVNLPAGDYVLRTTDGDWFYGCVPFTVRPAGEAPPTVKQKAQPLNGLRRFWHDVKQFDLDEMRRK